ncbi:phage holin family protein [Clostridioides mangenotii]|uniref:phage holin family protein n=1 Tax=Metaclostridioides mangenotii TaxID=1540 RepID=UPI002149B4DF|nr:phage holin family protein [Clostridioides mangenotii]MCR1955141.1 phage holin family protein [Clostridioides mangenotii]
MNVYSERISATIGVIGTVITWFIGAWDMATIVLVSFMALDFITGLLKGKFGEGMRSEKCFVGIKKKASILIVLIVAVCLDRLIGNGTWVFRTLTCYFYIANEGISILENCGQLGVNIPEPIRNALEQLRDKGE